MSDSDKEKDYSLRQKEWLDRFDFESGEHKLVIQGGTLVVESPPAYVDSSISDSKIKDEKKLKTKKKETLFKKIKRWIYFWKRRKSE